MKRLTHLRMARGWTKAELARRARVHPSQIGLFESGRLIPYEGQLAKLATALEVDASVNLLADLDPPESALAVQ